MAFKMKGFSPFTEHEEGHSSNDEANREAYEGFHVGKNPQFRKKTEPNELGHY